MKVKVDSEVIAEIRNALLIVIGNAELLRIKWGERGASVDKLEIIIKEINRIDNLLPGKI